MTEPVPILIGDRWLQPDSEQSSPVHRPATGEVIAQTPHCTSGDVDRAVAAAQAAFPAWSRTPAPDRARVLFNYRELLEANFEELAGTICRENGKTREEARGDVRRGIEVVELACGIGHLAKGEVLPELASGIDGMATREPVGVCAGITPFNFPAMVPMWMYPLAIACGNCFLLKPSEKVPFTANRLAELFVEAGLPPGVLGVIHGGRDVVEALCLHPGIAAVSFVGSSPVARRVYELAGQTGKRCQAAGGAKNVLFVMPDAVDDPTVKAILQSAFGCAGQRCMAGSLLLGVGDACDGLRDQVVSAMDTLTMGDTLADDDVSMGPVIDGAARERLVNSIGSAEADLTLVRDGREGVPDAGFFVGPTLLDHLRPEHDLFSDELFGPVLGLMRPQTLAEAIDWVNRIPYGNAATIFTRDGGAARTFAREVSCGMVGINVGVPAPMALFSFSGWDQSFFGDLHVQGTEGVLFYTRQKTTLTRWQGATTAFTGVGGIK
ncbi:MAG TPA: CoA-acylating methylmalonate-semialdehyde dehydrogenase [Candidatus Latescibacteria bacterium]|jgi:malonate-semialdehyde dehydrogenase (acetylating)/methylmalonate-semialdehyde dehydrogenase|nr:CoA-acylating methylmalonate-semialdehyde dehydrogenase [Candidatus Latescibacterota bacterium]HJP30233.1 CoA-acylating methylmalonate-semialdehyde dehydrogenase [Candidatus Latescibacterota bacterium]